MSYFYIRSCILVLVLSGMPLQAMNPPRPKRNICFRVLGALASVVKWPLKKAGGLFAEGVKEEFFGSPGPSHEPVDADPQEKAMRKHMDRFFSALNKATDPKETEAAGTQLLKNLVNTGAITMGELCNPDGEGRKALRKLFRMLKEYVTKDGAIKVLVEDIRNMAVE